MAKAPAPSLPQRGVATITEAEPWKKPPRPKVTFVLPPKISEIHLSTTAAEKGKATNTAVTEDMCSVVNPVGQGDRQIMYPEDIIKMQNAGLGSVELCGVRHHTVTNVYCSAIP